MGRSIYLRTLFALLVVAMTAAVTVACGSTETVIETVVVEVPGAERTVVVTATVPAATPTSVPAALPAPKNESGTIVIAVVYTFRDRHVRLISARRARRYERERYRDRAATRRR